MYAQTWSAKLWHHWPLQADPGWMCVPGYHKASIPSRALMHVSYPSCHWWYIMLSREFNLSRFFMFSSLPDSMDLLKCHWKFHIHIKEYYTCFRTLIEVKLCFGLLLNMWRSLRMLGPQAKLRCKRSFNLLIETWVNTLTMSYILLLISLGHSWCLSTEQYGTFRQCQRLWNVIVSV